MRFKEIMSLQCLGKFREPSRNLLPYRLLEPLMSEHPEPVILIDDVILMKL